MSERRKTDRTIAVDPRLHHAFEKLAKAGRARLDYEVSIPFLERKLEVPYAYQNGVWNLVKPHHFAGRAGLIINSAMLLAGKGELLERSTANTEDASKLIVVPTFDPSVSANGIPKRLTGILEAFHVRSISESEIPNFVKEVQKGAH